MHLSTIPGFRVTGQCLKAEEDVMQVLMALNTRDEVAVVIAPVEHQMV